MPYYQGLGDKVPQAGSLRKALLSQLGRLPAWIWNQGVARPMLPLSPLRKALFLDCLQMPPSSPVYGSVTDHTLGLSVRPYIQAIGPGLALLRRTPALLFTSATIFCSNKVTLWEMTGFRIPGCEILKDKIQPTGSTNSVQRLGPWLWKELLYWLAGLCWETSFLNHEIIGPVFWTRPCWNKNNGIDLEQIHYK